MKFIEKLIINPLNFILGRRIFLFLNIYVIKLFLRFIGYNSYGNLEKTGEKKFIDSIVNQNEAGLIIDIGANNGEYSEYILKNSNYNVIAFEPLSKSFHILKKLKQRFSKRFTAFNYALSNKKGKTSIYYDNKNTIWANLDKEVNKIKYLKNNNKKKICKIDTLDNFFKKNKKFFLKKVKLIKIDVEGHEYEVIEGSGNLIKKLKPKYIQIEYNWHHLIKNRNLYSFSKLLKNYDVFKIMPYFNKIEKIDPIKPENNYFNYSNIVFKIKMNK